MDVIVHIGAHRTGTTAFQAFLQANRLALADQGTAIWLPPDIRGGPLSGMLRRPGGGAQALADIRLERRIGRALEAVRAAGAQRLILSEENLLGTMAGCLAQGAPYACARARMRRLDRLFGGRIRRVGLGLRSSADWWASVLAFRIVRGGPMPDAALIARLAAQTRGWSGVAQDLAGALPPGCPVVTWRFEDLVDRPRQILSALLGTAPPGGLIPAAHGRNASLRAEALVARLSGPLPPGLAVGLTGRWMPFTAPQRAALDARHAQDLARLGLTAPGTAISDGSGPRPGVGAWKEGQLDDRQDRSLEDARAKGAA